MPFNVTRAAAFVRRIVLRFNQEKLEIHYNAGEKYREYENKVQKVSQDYAALERRVNTQAGEVSEEDYQALIKAMADARRLVADNICTVIESWDLEGDLDAIKENMSKKDKDRYKAVTGEGVVPVDGAWLDALPLSTDFIFKIRDGIQADFDSGGAGGKANLRAS